MHNIYIYIHMIRICRYILHAIYVYMSAYVYVYVSICVYVYVCVCVYVYNDIYIYTLLVLPPLKERSLI